MYKSVPLKLFILYPQKPTHIGEGKHKSWASGPKLTFPELSPRIQQD